MKVRCDTKGGGRCGVLGVLLFGGFWGSRWGILLSICIDLDPSNMRLKCQLSDHITERRGGEMVGRRDDLFVVYLRLDLTGRGEILPSSCCVCKSCRWHWKSAFHLMYWYRTCTSPCTLCMWDLLQDVWRYVPSLSLETAI